MPYLAGVEFRFYDDVDALVGDFRAGDLDGASGLPAAAAVELGATDGARLVRYPGSTLTAVLLNLRPGHPEFSSPGVRTGLLAGLDRAEIGREAFGGLAVVATGPIPAVSPMFDAAADPVVPYSRRAAEAALKAAKWTKDAKGWALPRAKRPLGLEVLSPTEASNPGLYAAAAAVVSDWKRIGLDAKHVALPPAEFVGKRLTTGTFQVAVADLRVGLDPDLYPLLASSQTLTGGSNVIGVQSSALDFVAREGAGAWFGEGPKGRLQRPPEAARDRSIPAPGGLRGRGRRAPRHGPGTHRATGHGRVGSILGCANMAPRRRPVTVGRGPCRGGGIGRRAGFRYQWPQGRVGSSPSLGTIPSDPSPHGGHLAQVAELVYAYV